MFFIAPLLTFEFLSCSSLSITGKRFYLERSGPIILAISCTEQAKGYLILGVNLRSLS